MTELDFLRNKLLGVLTTPNPYAIAGRSTAKLDAAEALIRAGASPAQLEQVRYELLAGINGERGYESAHVVRAAKILIDNFDTSGDSPQAVTA